MSTYTFELHGCTDENLATVEAALMKISGLTCRVTRSARGSFVVFIESELSESEVIALINSALSHLGVSVGKAPKPSGPKF